ncbi:MAG TPA: T9SS type A sorting domain-containing protein [Chitinophagales bacterium]|nr:T9SS type A sorting domain-containing protein [Chitinophagales bacterium]
MKSIKAGNFFIPRFIQRSFSVPGNFSIGGTIFLTVTLALLFSLASAQTVNTPPTISWQKSFGGSGDDVPNCISPTSDGGYIIAGASNSNDGDITGNHGHNDFCLIKIDASGNLVWQHSYGSTGIEEAIGVVPALDGGFAVAGKNSLNNGDITGNHGSSDYCLIKTDGQGMIQWQKSYGGSGAEIANSMASTSDNGFVIAGKSYSNDGDVSGNHGDGDAWIIKLDQYGTLLWQKSYGGSLKDVANDVHQTTDGGYIVAGYSLSNDGDITSNYGQEDYWFFKLDANGNLEWTRSMGGTGGDTGSGVAQTLDGGYVITGLSHTMDDFDVIGSHGAHEMWVVKTDSNGSTQWTLCLGGSLGDNGKDIKQQTDGTIIACGYTESTDGDVSGLHGLNDIWLTALDTAGNLLWQKTLGGSNDEYPFNLQLLSAGQYIVAGKSNSNDGDVSVNHGGFDFWIVKLNPACNNVFYIDADGDGYGDINSMITACSAPSGYVTDHTDCNDNPASGSAIHPAASDICNSIDDNCDGTVDENAITATVTPAGTVAICDGSSITLSANSGTAITYQWIKGSKNVSGATNQTYSANKAAGYKVKESNSFGCSSTSAVTTVNLTPRPSASISYTSLDLCGQSSITLTANSGTGLTWQWLKGGNNITGATNQTYSANKKGSYKVIVTNSSGCTKTSASVTVTKSCKESSNSTFAYCMQLEIFPNPAEDHTTIQFSVGVLTDTLSQSSHIYIKVYDVSGKEIATLLDDEDLDQGDHSLLLNTNQFSKGVYLVKMISDFGIENQKLIVQ